MYNDCGLKPAKYFTVKELDVIPIIRILIVTFVYRVRTNMID